MMEKRMKRIVAFILSFVMMLLMPFTNGYVTETKADDYSCKIYFKLPDGTTASDWGVYSWGEGVTLSGATGTVIVTAWAEQEFPALTDEGNGFASITLTATGAIQGVMFVKADGSGYTYGIWNTLIQEQGFAEAYFNTADEKWYKESTFATEILAPVLDDIYYVVGSEGMTGENWSWNTDNGLMTEVLTGVFEVTFERVADGNYEFKIVQDPKEFGWDHQINNGSGGNITVTADKGSNDITITLDAATKAVTTTVEKSPINGADVVEMIAALPRVDAITLADEAAVAAAEVAYEGLSDDEKANVSNYGVLVDLRAKLDELQQAVVDVKIHFENSLEWENVAAYAFDYNGGELLGNWPGEELVENANNEGWLSVTVSTNSNFSIVINGSRKQTDDKPIAVAEGITEVWITMTGDLVEEDAGEYYEIVVSTEAPEGWIDDGNPSDDPETPEGSGKFYFDNSITQWEEVYVWAWVGNDDLWALNNGFMSWPGIELEIDEATGYYVYECAEVVDGINVMFNNAGQGEQTNAIAASTACAGNVFVPEYIDEDGRWYGSWYEFDLEEPEDPEEPVVPDQPGESGKFYFDNSVAQWEEVCVWCWVTGDDMWSLDNGFEAWPGIALEKDATTGYYVYECAEVVDGINVMFNNAGQGEQINDIAASSACARKVFIPEVIDEDGRWNGSWRDIDEYQEGKCGDNAVWKLFSDGFLIISGTGTIECGWNAEVKEEISSVQINDGITGIEEGTFSGCSNIKSVEMPNSVVSIGEEAFFDCSSLETINLSSNITNIGSKTFMLCGELKSIEIPEGVINIGDSAFEECKKLQTIDIPESVNSIGAGAFEFCIGLNSIYLPRGLTSIDESTFSFCTNLKYIDIPDSVTRIGNHAFNCCESLTTMFIPQNVKSIGDFAFIDCSELKFVIMPSGATSVGKMVFNGNDCLEFVAIPKTVTSIGESLFDKTYSGKIYGDLGSFAETYAKENGYTFVDVEANNVALSKILYKTYMVYHDYETGLRKEYLMFDENGIVEIGTNVYTIYEENSYDTTIYIDYNGKRYYYYGGSGYGCNYYLDGSKIYISYRSVIDMILRINRDGSLTVVYSELNSGHNIFNEGDILNPERIDITTENISLSQNRYIYNGTEYMPEVIVDNLMQNVDYEVTYTNNINVGTATVTITGIGNYIGEVTKTFEIVPAQITEVTLDKTEYTYDGKAKNPAVTVKANGKTLVEDKDYTVAYKNNKNAGIATVTVFGKGNYTRIIEKDFKINPSAIKNFTYSARSSSAVALKWTKNASATGYIIEQYKSGKWIEIKTITKNTTTSYKVTDLSASTANKFRIKAYCKAVGDNMLYSSYTTKTVNTLPLGVKNFTYSTRSSSAIALKWTKNTSATGYVIEQYKSGKWVKIKTITKNSTVSYKVTGLKASTANKFRIKAYKSYGKTNLYSGYVSKSINTLPSGVKNFAYSARTKNTITLKWAKNTSATGYVVEQYKNGKWTKIKTITKNSTVSCKVSGLKKATSYKFRIKAYKSYGKTNLYSGYVTKTIKTK